jgi:hypothetical protein
MPDLAIINAKVWTVNPRQPTAEAVAVRGERVTAVGSNARVRALLDRDARVIDAAGKLLLPGFNDAHVHFLGGGTHLLGVDLRRAGNEEEFLELLRDHVAALPKGRWVTGGRWDHEAWPGRSRPTRWLIDPVTPLNPVLLSRLDGHIAVANSLALGLAGITADTPDPPGGQIERDPRTGVPTGILIDGALRLVRRVVPQASPEEQLAALRAAMRHAAAVGVTSVQSMCSPEELQLLQQLRSAGQLDTRVYACLEGLAEPMMRIGLRPAFGDSLLRIGAAKVFVDGSLGARSALLFASYADDPSTNGLAIHPEEELCRMAAEADAGGLQFIMHAIGDKAVHWALNAFQRAAEHGGRHGSRHRIEHAQVMRPEDRERFARLGVIASIQPSHCTDDMRWLGNRLGERVERASPFRSLLDAGARVAFGTDWPVEALDPLLTVHAAVTRQSADGQPPGGWRPEERVGVAEAVEAYTLGSAYAEFQEKDKGSIEPGKLADMVLLSEDLLSIPPGEIPSAKVELTLLGGRVIYERGKERATSR